jgi:hypothetical protein
MDISIGFLNGYTTWQLVFPRLSDPKEEKKSDRESLGQNSQSFFFLNNFILQATHYCFAVYNWMCLGICGRECMKL